MSVSLTLTGYDISDEGPARSVNEDATLVREDLGLFAVADGTGGRGLGDVAANLALRTLENFVGSSVRRCHERPDFDLLGTPEQARRLSAAIHQAHENVKEIAQEDAARKGMATTIVALLFAPRTGQVHLAHVGDSRCYRLRHGRLERLTVDHTIATDILERKPSTPDDVLRQLPPTALVAALGTSDDLRVEVRTLDLAPGDRFLLCTDGLTSAVDSRTLWSTMREAESPDLAASELLNHALGRQTQDNVTILVADCSELSIDEDLETRRYNEIPQAPRTPIPEEEWSTESEPPTLTGDESSRRAARELMIQELMDLDAKNSSSEITVLSDSDLEFDPDSQAPSQAEQGFPADEENRGSDEAS